MKHSSRPRTVVRLQGRIVEWDDARGFGFILPNGGGDRVFLHIKALASSRRPSGNEWVNYHVAADVSGRLRAERVEYTRHRKASVAPVRSTLPLLWLSGAALAFVAAASMTSKLPSVIAVAYFAMSLIAFAAYGLDKSAARQGRWRTKESTLHVLSLAGGWPGALAAQQLLRHKSRKTSFQSVFWVTVVLNVCALLWLLSSAGTDFLSRIVPI